jgi:hypothetical protein
MFTGITSNISADLWQGIGEVVALGQGVKSLAIGSRVGIQIAGDACLSCGKAILSQDMLRRLLLIDTRYR